MMSGNNCLIVALLLGCFSVSHADEPFDASDEEKIKGVWIQTKFSRGVTTIDGLDFVEWHFREGRYTRHSPGLAIEFRYRLDPSQSPKTFDVWYEGDDEIEKGRERVVRGIYKFEGDKLIRCYAQPGEPRPTKFESKVGTSLILDVLERKDDDRKRNR